MDEQRLEDIARRGGVETILESGPAATGVVHPRSGVDHALRFTRDPDAFPQVGRR